MEKYEIAKLEDTGKWYHIEKPCNTVGGLPVLQIVSAGYKTYEEAARELEIFSANK